MSSTERFGFEWARYSHIDSNYESQFKGWVYPLTPQDFYGKKVLDAGCGMGRNSFWALKWGAKEIVAFDFDQRSVSAAKKNLAGLSNAQVLYQDIYQVGWYNEFDIVFSIGVIHHLKDPQLAIKRLYQAVKPGGRLLLWVYGYEGNERIIKLINPVRKNLTSKLPLPLVHFLAYFCSLPLYLFIKIFKGPGSYLKQLSHFKFWHVHSIIFDQLIPEVANYWTKQQIIELLANLNLTKVDIHPPLNQNGWIIIINK